MRHQRISSEIDLLFENAKSFSGSPLWDPTFLCVQSRSSSWFSAPQCFSISMCESTVENPHLLETETTCCDVAWVLSQATTRKVVCFQSLSFTGTVCDSLMYFEKSGKTFYGWVWLLTCSLPVRNYWELSFGICFSFIGIYVWGWLESWKNRPSSMDGSQRKWFAALKRDLQC